MIANTVGILLESADEKSGVIMAEKENEIQEIIDYICQWWAAAKGDVSKMVDRGNIGIAGDDNVGTVDLYRFSVPNHITKKLDVALNHEFEVFIKDLHFDMNKYGQYIGHAERSTNGTSYGGEDYTRFIKPQMKFSESKIDVTVPAINGQLQLQGLYVTLYHELNHNVSTLRINQKGFEGRSVGDMNRRNNYDRHVNMMQALNPHPFVHFGRRIQYGENGAEVLHMMIFMIYGLWETTERNARAESLYGDLLYMKSTPETFEEDFKKTDVYYCIEQFKDFIRTGQAFDDNSSMWKEIANLTGHKNANYADPASVKRRFLKRSQELVNILYQKAMKVAKFYFQKKGFTQAKAPGM